MSPRKGGKPGKVREKPEELGEKAKAFIREYCICLNIEEAQKKVGYQPHHGNGRRILDDPRAQAELKRNKRRAEELAGVHNAWILAKLMNIAGLNTKEQMRFNERGDFVGIDIKNLTAEQVYAISEIGFDSDGRPKIKFHDKIAALKMLKDHVDPPKPQRVRLEGKDGGPVEIIDGLGARLNAARERVKSRRSGNAAS